ncbi:MAG: hypothetical protein WA962_09590 [Ornithinimicrobium sp.]
MPGESITSRCGDVSFTHPAAWVSAHGDAQTCVAVEPTRCDGGFRANLVLTVRGNASLSFGEWQAATDRLLPLLLHDYEVLDLERIDVAGYRGGRRAARHRAPCGRWVTMTQWFTSVRGYGITLTGTVDAPSGALLTPIFGQAASTLTVSSSGSPATPLPQPLRSPDEPRH